MRRAYVIHPGTLTAEGLAARVATLSDAEPIVLCPDSWTPADDEESDCYLICPWLLALYPSFFLPRRRRTAIVLGEPFSVGGEEPDEGAFFLLGEWMSAAEQTRVIGRLMANGTAPRTESTLSAREAEVLREIAAGISFKEIAEKLCISLNTVMTHRKNISAKLGIRSTSGLTVYALMNGIV